MPLTQIDAKPALVVIDLQKGIAGLPTVHPIADIIARTVLLAIAFRECDLPVVLVNVTGAAPGRTDAGPRTFSLPPDWTELVLELEAIPGHSQSDETTLGSFPRHFFGRLPARARRDAGRAHRSRNQYRGRIDGTLRV